MGYSLITSNPILFMIAVLLTVMACYTALDLMTAYLQVKKHRTLLFLGSCCSMGFSVWILTFLPVFTLAQEGISFNDIAWSLLSLALGIAFCSLGIFVLTQKVSRSTILFCSLTYTMGLLSNYLICMYYLNNMISIISLFTITVLTFVFMLFSTALLVLFHVRQISQSSLKPISTIIISGTIVEGYLLLFGFNTVEAVGVKANTFSAVTPLMVYLVCLVSVFILAGLIASSTIAGRRLANSDRQVQDIRFALDQSSIVAITDEKGIITYVNEKFLEISQYEEHELLGNTHAILNSGYHSKKFFTELWTTISSGKTWHGEICNRSKDGELYWVDTTIVPFMKRGKPYQYISIRSDISRRKKAEDDLMVSIKELKDMYYAINQSSIVAITDHEGVITEVNDKFTEISGYSRSELIGQTHKIINSGYHSKIFFEDMWKTISAGRVWNGEVRNRAKDGSFYWVDTTIVPFLTEEGIPRQFLAIRYDITERKQTEEKIHRQDKLAAVGQLAAGVAHEIRNPLTSMRGYTEFLQLDEQDPSRQECLDIILDEIHRVNEIVEEFLELAKPQKLNLETQNIVPIVQNVMTLVELDAEKNKIDLIFDCYDEALYITCDENRLKQVLLNFVKNGMEAMPKGGQLRVSLEEKGGKIHVKIADSGIGMTTEQLRRLGEPFFTTKKSGNGLGLMVSFKIIESHNGEVSVESEWQKGTVFNVLLPAEQAQAGKSQGEKVKASLM